MSFLNWINLFSRQVILTHKRKKKQSHLLHTTNWDCVCYVGIAKRMYKWTDRYKMISNLPSILHLEKMQTVQVTTDWEILG